MRFAHTLAAAVVAVSGAAAAETVEIKGRLTNALPDEQRQRVEVVVTDRVGVVLGRTRLNRRGQYELKISGPRYVILKAVLEGYPPSIYQIDTQEVKESTDDREENKAFGELRIPTYYQNVTLSASGTEAPLSDMLAGEPAEAVRAYKAARAHKESGNTAKALASLEKLVRDYPGFYLAYIDLGMTLTAQGSHDKAIEIFSEAQKLRPEHSWAYFGHGLALNNKQQYQSAAPLLEKALELEPNSVNALYQLGQASFKLGNHERARQCLERVIALEPKFEPMAYKTLAAIFVAQQDRLRAAKALESYLLHFSSAPDTDKVKQILEKLSP